jgi:hypothetical protein
MSENLGLACSQTDRRNASAVYKVKPCTESEELLYQLQIWCVEVFYDFVVMDYVVQVYYNLSRQDSSMYMYGGDLCQFLLTKLVEVDNKPCTQAAWGYSV